MKRKSDFTLVELAIIIAIVAIFALMWSGCFLRSPFESKHRTSCTNNLKQIGTALELYSISNDSRMPGGPAPIGESSVLTEKDFYTAGGRAGGFELLRVNDNLTDYKIFVCPSTSVTEGKGNESLSWSKEGSGSGKPNLSYAYHAGMTKGDSSMTGKPASGVCGDLTGTAGSTTVGSNGGAPNHSKFGNILFLDGHVKGFDGLGWFSPANTGYPVYKGGNGGAMTPNTLRHPQFGTNN